MKIFFILFLMLGSSIAFCSQTVAIRVSQNKNSHMSFLLEVFHFDFFSDDLLPLESKLNHDMSLSLNNSNGVFFLENKKITWSKEELIIQPGDFLIQMKNSKREVNLSGNLAKVSNNCLNIDLDYTFLRPITTKYGIGQDFFSFSCDCSLKLEQIQVCGSYGTVKK